MIKFLLIFAGICLLAVFNSPSGNGEGKGLVLFFGLAFIALAVIISQFTGATSQVNEGVESTLTKYRPHIITWVAIALTTWGYLYGFSLVGLARAGCTGSKALLWGVSIATLMTALLFFPKVRENSLSFFGWLAHWVLVVLTAISRLPWWLAALLYLVLIVVTAWTLSHVVRALIRAISVLL